MKIGIIGPSNIDEFCKSTGFDKEKYVLDIKNIAKNMALINTSNIILLVPELGSISEVFAKEYKILSDKKIIGVIPMDDTEFGIEKLDVDLVDEIINCVTWRNQSASLAENCDLLLCFGFGSGTLIEIIATKYWKSKVLIIEDFITSKLPKELERDIKVDYIKKEEVLNYL